MRIFALETNVQKVVERFCSSKECIILLTFYHPFYFTSVAIKEIFITSLLVGIGLFAWSMGVAMSWILGFTLTIWLGFALPTLTKAFIDWKCDFLLVTTDKIVLLDQTSFFKREIKPIHIENIGSVGMKTQWMGIFSFGSIYISLKEGEGGETIVRKYVPNVTEVVSKMSSVVTNFQRGAFEENQKNRYKIEPGQNKWTTHAQVNNELLRKREQIEAMRKELDRKRAQQVG